MVSEGHNFVLVFVLNYLTAYNFSNDLQIFSQLGIITLVKTIPSFAGNLIQKVSIA